MASVFPRKYALVIAKDDVAKALGESGAAIKPAASDLESSESIIVPFDGTAPEQISVTLTDAKGSQTRSVKVGSIAVFHDPTDKPRKLDPARPLLLVVAGILASSVAILVATFAAVSGKDAGGPLQPMLVEVMSWMAVVVVLSTIAAVVLQGFRLTWKKLDIADRPWANAVFWPMFLAGLILSAWPVCYGWRAARAAVVGGLAVADKSDRIPWVFGGADAGKAYRTQIGKAVADAPAGNRPATTVPANPAPQGAPPPP